MFKALVLLVFGLTVSGAQAAQAPISYPIEKLVAADGKIVLQGGKSVRMQTPLSKAARIEFVDLLPGANWTHPARIEIRAQDGKLSESIPVRVPPRGLLLGKLERIAFQLSDFDGKYKVKTPEHFFALLINGSADQRHRNDFAFLYRTLVQVYGYLPKNIFVADSNFISSSDADLDGDGQPDIGYQSTVGGVEALMKQLGSKLTSEDQLLIATDDHGDTQDGESTLYLYDDEMKASKFAALLSAIPAGRVLSIHEPCYSGGFVRVSTGPNRAAMAAASNRELSWGSADLLWDEFIYHVISAFAHQTYDGKPVNADTDGDARVSGREAFAWAVAHDRQPESPVAEDEANAGFLSNIGLGF